MHILFSEEERNHPLARIDARIKVLCAAAVLVMLLTCRGFMFPLFVALLCLAACGCLRVPFKRLLVRFSEPAFIVAMLIAIKFLFSGKEAMGTWHIWGLAITGHWDGLTVGLFLGLRIISAVSLVAVLGFATPFAEFLGALAWLRVPKGFIEISIFAYRFIFLLLDDATVIYCAQKNRLGYSSIRRGISSFGALASALVLKAFDNSQQAALGMIQRGYDGSMPFMSQRRLKSGHLALSAVFLILMAAAWTI